jgi:hypothetical protein
LPGCTEPASPSIPFATAGQIVYLATYRRARRLSAAPSPGSEPRFCFITCAVCHVRSTTSPTRPIACASEPIIEIAPRSCSRSSAAIVVGRIRLSPKARWWQTMSMSRCSSRVLTVCGRVGFVLLGSTFGCPATVMMSGA